MTHTFTATKEGEDTQEMVWENKNQGDVDGTKTFWALVTAMQGQGWTFQITSLNMEIAKEADILQK